MTFKNSHRSLSIALALALAFSSQAYVSALAAEIKGVTLNAITDAPLTGATVWLEPADATLAPSGVETDSEGEFAIEAPSGAYTLTFSYVGFSTETLTSVAIDAMSAGALVMRLTPTALNMNTYTVTASRRPEKLVDAPAAISIIESDEIEERISLSIADHVAALPGIDVVNTGLNSSNVVNRGFNNIFSTTLMTMVDNRIARVPSLRVNVYQFISATNEDIDHIEVVSGPGSALYGPNAANGVLHILTKSPLSSAGTSISIAGGEREVGMVSFRHAGATNGKFGYKLSGQYYQGVDWKTTDPLEPDSIRLLTQSTTGNVVDSDFTNNTRDFDIKKLNLDGRVDVVLDDNSMLIFSAGYNKASNIELTGLGAAQVIGWQYGYGQARLTHKNLFAQFFVNISDAGDTYIRRSGARIIDKSRLYAGQLQHSYKASPRQRFTYGFDALWTRPNSSGTIHGANEDNDNINEYGAYLQSETDLTDKLTFIAAGRVDDHNLLAGTVFSPRAALRFKANEKNTFRATYNQAYSTPSTLNFFLDVLSARITMADADSALIPLIPFLGNTFFNARGTGAVDGFTFSYAGDGRPQMVSLYGNMMGVGNMYLPANAQSVWPAMRAILVGGDAALDAVLPAALSGAAPGQYMALNTVSGGFDPFDATKVADLKPIAETKTTTFELGYKGIIGRRLAVSVNGYYTEIKDFIGPLRVETPHVFIDPATFVPQLTADIVATTGMPDTSAQTIAIQIAGQIGSIPIGLVSPTEVQNATDVIITYRNFGNINLLGADIAIDYHLNQYWNAGVTYSWLEKNFFNDVDGIADIPVNAPQNKASAKLRYSNPHLGLRGQARLRYVDAFPVNSGVYNGWIRSYGIFDLDLEYEFAPRTTIALTIQNAFDNMHVEFIGAPALGRLSILRLKREI